MAKIERLHGYTCDNINVIENRALDTVESEAKKDAWDMYNKAVKIKQNGGIILRKTQIKALNDEGVSENIKGYFYYYNLPKGIQVMKYVPITISNRIVYPRRISIIVFENNKQKVNVKGEPAVININPPYEGDVGSIDEYLKQCVVNAFDKQPKSLEFVDKKLVGMPDGRERFILGEIAYTSISVEYYIAHI